MDKKAKGGSILTGIAGALWAVWKEMFNGLKEVLPRLIGFIFWILAGLVVLPCVYIAAQWYPLWQKWGEKL